MVRCDQFYAAMNKDRGFCKKSPETVRRILKHIPLMSKIEEKVSQSQILQDSSHPIGEILSENAARPLHALKGADLDKALDLIIKNAEAKEIDDQSSIAVGCKEVQEIVNKIVPPKAKKPKVAKADAFETATGILQTAFNGGIPDEDIPATIGKIGDLMRTLESQKAALTQRLASVNTRDNNTDLLGQEEQQGRAEA